MCVYILYVYIGLCGSPRLLDIGGVPYLMPTPDHTKVERCVGGGVSELVCVPNFNPSPSQLWEGCSRAIITSRKP